MSNWPVISSEAEFECDQLSTSHRPIPLPAYDINGKLIPPDRCETLLGGAVVRVMFTLNHRIIKSMKAEESNIFDADIHSIRILVNASSQMMAPRKRKTFNVDPSDETLQNIGKKMFMK